MPSTWCGWGSPPSMTCAAGCNSTPAGIGADARIRCTASAGCCAAAPSTSALTAGRGCWAASRPATSTVRSPPPRSLPKSGARSTAAAIVTGPRAAFLYDWTVMCIDSQVPELGRLARTLTTWRDEFLAYFNTGRISNGPTEAVNLLIKKILRVGHGFRNFGNYRLRLLLHCGITRQHHTPTPLRGRLPRLAA